MCRRAFMALFAGAAPACALWPRAARAQQFPVIGFLRSSPAAPFAHIVDAFRRGLSENGFVEGTNVAIEQRWADNALDRLPELAADLVRRQVALIVGNGQAIAAARQATATIPIVFVIGDDPVAHGLVASLNRPGGNLTGLTFFGNRLAAKRMELLLELVPSARLIALVIDVDFSAAMSDVNAVLEAGQALGRQVVVVKAGGTHTFEDAFAAMVKAGVDGLVVGGSAFMTSQSQTIVELAARHAIPTIYDIRDHVVAGGLISYAASFTDAYRQAGVYAGRILKGARPSDLPVLQPTTFELVVNLKTAKKLGLTVPPSIVVRADEVIE